MTQYNFTERIDRSNSGAKKWNLMYEQNPNVSQNVMPMSVADMEFDTAPEIKAGLKDYIDESIFGYVEPMDTFYDAVINWQAKHHNWDVKRDWILTTPGVVVAINLAVQTYTKPGDGVITFTPVYDPFTQAVENTDRNLINIPLIEVNNHYSIDFDKFEQAAKENKNKLLLFCSPHNPIGRVWTSEELQTLAKIVEENNLRVFSDELWDDLVLGDNQHTVLADINDYMKNHTITAHAASKTFNLAGMHTSTMIIPNADLRIQFQAAVEEAHLSVNMLGYKATELAYNYGEDWLAELIKVIEENQHLSNAFFKENLPEIIAPVSEATYVQWLDFRKLDLSQEDLSNLLINEAELFLNEGTNFGEEGEGFARINLAVPTEVLKESLNRLYQAVKNR